MSNRIFLTVKDLQTLSGKSRSACSRKFQQIKDSLNKSIHQQLTIFEYCEYENLSVQSIAQVLGLKLKS
jgi:hypothetical protein